MRPLKALVALLAMTLFSVLTPATQAEAAAKMSARVTTNVHTAFAELGDPVERRVVVRYRSSQMFWSMTGKLVIAGGKDKGKQVGKISWYRGTGRGGATWDEISTEWKIDVNTKVRMKQWQKVKYQVTVTLLGDDDTYQKVTSSWYTSKLDFRC